jgi:hypothetical protein
LLRAIELRKPRWLLAHDHVVFARTLLKNLGYGDRKVRSKLSLKKTPIFDDLRVIDMYEDAVSSEKPIRDRQGNWVQKFGSDDDAAVFATAQFSRYQEVEAFVEENFKNSQKMASDILKNGGGA